MSSILDCFSRCKTWPIDVIYSDNESQPLKEIAIEFNVNFYRLNLDSIDEEDLDFDFYLKLCLEPPKNTHTTFFVQADTLLNPETSSTEISAMLSGVCVDAEAFMIEIIRRGVEQMAMDYRGVRRARILRIGVLIDVLVDELPLMLEDDAEDIMEDFSDDEIPVQSGLVPASKSLIEALKTVTVEKDSSICAICLDSFEKGKEASRMPCSHLFHGNCITNWLNRSGLCPLCRFEMPID